MEGRGKIRKKESRTAYNEMACSAADNVLRRRMLMAEGDQKQRFHFLFICFCRRAAEQTGAQRGFGASAGSREGPWEEEMTHSKCRLEHMCKDKSAAHRLNSASGTT